ncbi:adenosine deaminase-like protein [Coccinella septempunctata]|uniref:adenosine deaminase-like protein n=1 Tax=Coccinella septempunctata TaxID=41139 RepID=UPI001D064331|nr:adenosine deaminase-like protein [Coccinella septempunctata]
MDVVSENNFCFALPKIELHAHLNGSLSDKILRILGCREEDVQDYQCASVDQRNLDDTFKKFGIAHKATYCPEAVYIATKNVIEEFSQENVIYLELRTTPRYEVGMSSETYVESVVRGIQDTKNHMMVKLILSLNRQHSIEKCQNHLDLILKMRSKYPDIIQGIDLSGNPIHGSFNELKYLFEKARKAGLSTTIHCGEIENSEEIKEVLAFKPDRLGHACYIHPNYNGCEKNWYQLKELKIPTEICLSSNVITGTCDYENHHVQEWIKDDLPFSLNTDDKGVFKTSLTQEFQYAMKFLNLSSSELWRISMNAIEHSFANSEEKSFLKSKLVDWKNKNLHFFTK